MSQVWFSRLTLNRDASAVAPIVNVLAPKDRGASIDVSHRLLWTAMPQTPHTQPSDRSLFLWRAGAVSGTFYVLGPRPTEQPYFLVETKPFAPSFASGDRLDFDLRANATVNRAISISSSGRPRRARLDVAFDRMLQEEASGQATKETRATRRFPTAQAAAFDWLCGQGEQYGFKVCGFTLSSYTLEHLLRGNAPKAKIAIFDLRGAIEITEPDRFSARLPKGFGKAKAFGCGLMLLRRLA